MSLKVMSGLWVYLYLLVLIVICSATSPSWEVKLGYQDPFFPVCNFHLVVGYLLRVGSVEGTVCCRFSLCVALMVNFDGLFY